jgi:catechol 2,3-dioxygenase-like lactoylglutathione lyase family enzyme
MLIFLGNLKRNQKMNTKAKLVGINHVALAVGNIDQALEFYGSVFDIKIRSRDQQKAFLDMGDQFLALFAINYQPHEDTIRHFGLVVDNRANVLELAEKAGAILTNRTPFMEFTDPWGNLIQIINYQDVEFKKDPEVLTKMGLKL